MSYKNLDSPKSQLCTVYFVMMSSNSFNFNPPPIKEHWNVVAYKVVIASEM